VITNLDRTANKIVDRLEAMVVCYYLWQKLSLAVLQIENKKRAHHHDVGKRNERNRQNKTQVSVRSC
jgi:hypothetical protein